MEREKVWHEFMNLTAEDQRKVADFITSLSRETQSGRSQNQANLEGEPFIGMWSGREDLENSTEWVRETREREWIERRR